MSGDQEVQFLGPSLLEVYPVEGETLAVQIGLSERERIILQSLPQTRGIGLLLTKSEASRLAEMLLKTVAFLNNE